MKNLFCKKSFNLAQKALILAVLVMFLEFCFPHFVHAQEEESVPNFGPVLLKIEKDKTIINCPELNQLKESSPRMVRWVTITAYSSTVDQCDDTPFITASNKWVYDGLVAANFLAFGTKIKIPDYFGDKVFTVDDRMNKKYNSRVDVWFPTREQAKQFGVRYLKIEVY